MSDQAAHATITVRRFQPRKLFNGAWDLADISPRSRLYSLAPYLLGTVWCESLSSYVHRLGWTLRTSPRTLVAQEIVPFLSNAQTFQSAPTLLSALSRGTGGAINMNGTGNVALEWAKSLEQLTARTDLQLLTLHWWIGDLSVQGQLRKAPAWCPMCYSKWSHQDLPIYQPLVWWLKFVTRCPQHRCSLEEQCPHCLKYQSVIPAKRTQPGTCTQCAGWLGADEKICHNQEMNDEERWQEWVIRALEELCSASASSGPPQWKYFFASLATCLEEPGGYSQLARVAGVSRTLFYCWASDETKSYHHSPSLESILKLCYACQVTPLQVLKHDLDALKQGLRLAKPMPLPQLRQPVRYRQEQVDVHQCQKLINEVLEGKEEPLGACQLAKRLGYGTRQLYALFPQECQLLTKRAKEYRKQQGALHTAQKCEEIRQMVIDLHAQGIYPSQRKLRQLLSDPNCLLDPEVRSAWYSICQELGIKS
jgi:hypothetical protein